MDERILVIKSDLSRLNTYVPQSKPWVRAKNRVIKFSKSVDPVDLIGLVPERLIREAHPDWGSHEDL